LTRSRVASALSPSEDPAFTSRLQLAFKLVRNRQSVPSAMIFTRRAG
jgi:hypothetical protein